MKPDLSVIIPAYNEEDLIEENLQKVMDIMQKSNLRFEIIVVDDGSTDESFRVIEDFSAKFKQISRIRHKKNKGYYAAVQTGSLKATGRYTGYVDIDLQYSPKDLVKFYQCAESLQISVIFSHADKSTYPPFRKILSIGKNFITALLFGLSYGIDINSLRIIKTDLIRKMNFSGRKGVFGVDLIIAAKRKSHPVFLLPMKVSERKKGKSAFKFKDIPEYAINLLFLWLEAKLPKPKISLSFDLEGLGKKKHKEIDHESNKASGQPIIKLMELLKRKNVFSTFFIDGDYAETEPENVRSLQKQGHEIGCLVHQNSNQKQLSPKQFKSHLSRATRNLTRLCLKKPRGFRSSKVPINDLVLSQLIDNGYLYGSAEASGRRRFQIWPSISIIEKQNKYLAVLEGSASPIELKSRVGLWLTMLAAWVNLKFRHETIIYSKACDLHNLERLIDYFQRKGYEFVTIESILK